MQKFSLLTNTSINKKWKPEYMANSAGNGCKMPLHAAFDELEAQALVLDLAPAVHRRPLRRGGMGEGASFNNVTQRLKS